MEQNRREFLKKSAIVGGAAWAAPAIATVSSAMAAGSTVGFCPGCKKSAFGLSATGLIPVGQTGVSGTAQECAVGTAAVGVAGLITASPISAVCGHASSTTCQAQACVANIGVTITPAITVTVNSLQTCASESTLSGTCTQCAQVNALVSINAGALGTFNLPTTFTCNDPLTPAALSGLISVEGNQQICNADGTRTVNGLVISALTVLGAISETVVLASVTVGGCTGCTCTSCASCNSCLQCGTCDETPTGCTA